MRKKKMTIEWKLIIFSKKFRFIFIILVTYLVARNLLRYAFYESKDIVDIIHGKNLKAVQLLTRKFSHLEWGLGALGQTPFERCAEKRCYAFKNELFLQTPLEKSDGVMVHLQNLFYMPSRSTYQRSRRQLWLFNTMEPQTFSFCSFYYDLTDLDDWFNITTTFKPQSTLITDYKAFSDWQSIFEFADYYNEFSSLFKQNNDFFAQYLKNSFQRFVSFLLFTLNIIRPLFGSYLFQNQVNLVIFL